MNIQGRRLIFDDCSFCYVCQNKNPSAQGIEIKTNLVKFIKFLFGKSVQITGIWGIGYHQVACQRRHNDKKNGNYRCIFSLSQTGLFRRVRHWSRKNTKTRRTQDDAFIELEHGFMYCMDPVGAGVIIDPSTRVSLDHEVLKFLTTDNVAAVVIDFQIQKQHRSLYFQNAQTIVTNSNANAVQINPGNELKPEAHKWLKGMTNWWQTTTVPRHGYYSVMLGVYGKQQVRVN